MKMPRHDIVVLDIAGNTARLYSMSKAQDVELFNMGFIRSGNDLTRPIANSEDRKNVVRFLIELGALFSSGRDWSPEELVQLYKDEGFTNQVYRVISWTDPMNYIVSSR